MSCVAGPSKKVRYGDPDFEETLRQWMNEVESDIDDCESDIDDCDKDLDIIREHDSDSETEISEDDENNLNREMKNKKNYFGKNNYKWSSEPMVSRSRTAKHNILKMFLPGLTRCAKNKLQESSKIIDFWSLLFQTDILEQVLKWTNHRIEKQQSKYFDKSRSEIKKMDLIELKAFIGLLVYTSVFKSNTENIETLFSTDGTGRDIFRAVMNQKRFAFILLCLRFDNPEDRETRREHDPATAISELFQKFVNNCQAVYTPGSNVCVDEMLIGFRGRCRFKMYMPMKPVKYGLKILCLTDARNNYFYNGYIYCGKNTDGMHLSEEEKRYSKPTQAVLRLSKPFFDSNRNVTADNWFSSIELVDILFDKGLTFVGTLKKNKREIPKEFLPARRKEVGSSMYGFSKRLTILSYVPKKNKVVIAVSSMHNTICTDQETNKPEIIAHYNLTKGGVDALDEKCSVYSCNRRTRRWSMAVFFQMLNISTTNAFILYSCYDQSTAMTRSEFLKVLAKQLVEPQMRIRLESSYLKMELKLCIRRILNIPEQKISKERLSTRKTCYSCPAKLKRKTQYLCRLCSNPICLQCSYQICEDCENNF